MSFSLIPTSFLIYMKGRTKIAVVFSACFFCTILCMVVCGVFNNPATSVIIFAAAIILIAICLYPGIINNKIVSSKVEFSAEGIEVIDKKGCYWRIIPYEAITNVQVEEVFGFFYGTNRERISSKYICFYLNGEKNHPNVPYRKLFFEPDFFMMGYQDDAFELFQRMYELHIANCKTDWPL